MKLTDDEREILNHRLGVPDAIIDALTDDPTSQYCPDAIADVVELCERGEFDKSIQLYPLTTRAVLKDCLDGSTFLATVNDAVENREITLPKRAKWRRAGQSLARKVSQFIGEKVEIATR